MKNIKFGNVTRKAALGDKVHLQKQVQEVVKCQQTGVLMLNIDADQLQKGDLRFIKKLGLTISNPDTDKPVALGVDYKKESWGQRIADFFASPSDGGDSEEDTSSGGESDEGDDDSEEVTSSRKSDDDSNDDDDSSFFHPTSGLFGGSSSFGGFGGSSSGGFGGFGGGSFGGGGASRSF